MGSNEKFDGVEKKIMSAVRSPKLIYGIEK